MQRPPSAHAIVECGRVALNHVDAFRSLGAEWTVAWSCARDPAVAAEFAREHGLPRVSHTIDVVLADPDVVSVVVDHARHATLVERELQASQHVLVEKPLALSVEKGERLLRIASDESYYKDSYWRGEGGSPLIHQGYHCLVAATARAGELYVDMHIEATLCVLLTAGPVPVSFGVTVGSTVTWRTRLEFVGTEGALELDLDHPGSLQRVSDNPELERRAVALALTVGEVTPGADYYGISHRRQAADIPATIHSGKEMAADARPGLAMVVLLTESYDAAGLPRSAAVARA